MSNTALRHTFMRRFTSLQKAPRVVAGLVVINFLSQIALAMAFGSWLLSLPISGPTIAGLVAVAIFIGTRLRGFNNIVHECSHATFTHQRADNVFFGRLCASFIMASFQSYRDEHLTHHAHLGDYDKDMDLHGIRALHLEDPLTPATILRHIVTPFIGLHLPYYLSADLSAKDGRGFQALKLGLIFAAVIFLIVAPVAALCLIWLPFIWAFTAINYWTDCFDHAGLLESEDILTSSRNIVAPPWLMVIFFPRNDCYHLVHHLFPQVPAHHLRDCHGQLMTHPDYQKTAAGLMPPPLRPNLPQQVSEA